MPVDFCITALDRYPLLKELLESIYKYYPTAEVTIADQSKDIDVAFYKPFPVKVLPLPYDCGLSIGRNTLFEQTKQPHKLLLEDDFLFTEETDVDKLITLSELYDIIGGAVYRINRIPFEAYLEKHGDTLVQVPDGDNWQEYKGIRHKPTGCVLNFGIFPEDVRWDERLKLREHQHFFYNHRHKKVGFTEDVAIKDNKRGNSPEYKKLKARDEYWKIAMEDMGVTKVKYLTGREVELIDGKIFRS
ncbi:MAG: glycosyltransferase [Gracilimonas sp.]